jgi:biotin transport system substrate-specific component
MIATGGLSIALLAVLAQIAIPLPGGVPLTLTTLGVVLVGMVFGAKRGVFIAVMYLLIGAVGIPVFSSLQGGVGAFLSFTGGFLYSFPLLALLAGLGYEWSERFGKTWILWLGLLLGTAVNYLFGLSHFMLVTGMSIAEAVPLVVAPFILGDLAKLAVGVFLSRQIRRVVTTSSANT